MDGRRLVAREWMGVRSLERGGRCVFSSPDELPEESSTGETCPSESLPRAASSSRICITSKLACGIDWATRQFKVLRGCGINARLSRTAKNGNQSIRSGGRTSSPLRGAREFGAFSRGTSTQPPPTCRTHWSGAHESTCGSTAQPLPQHAQLT